MLRMSLIALLLIVLPVTSHADVKAKAKKNRARAARKKIVKKRRDLNGDGKVTKKEKRRVNRVVSGQRETANFFKRHDKDGNGRVDVSEAPKGKKIGWFKRIDKNNDRSITRDEYFRHIRPGLHRGRSVRNPKRPTPGKVNPRREKTGKQDKTARKGDRAKELKKKALDRKRKGAAELGNAP